MEGVFPQHREPWAKGPEEKRVVAGFCEHVRRGQPPGGQSAASGVFGGVNTATHRSAMSSKSGACVTEGRRDVSVSPRVTPGAPDPR